MSHQQSKKNTEMNKMAVKTNIEERTEESGSLKLCLKCKEWLEAQLVTPEGLNIHILMLVLVTGGTADIVNESQCDRCRCRREIEQKSNLQ